MNPICAHFPLGSRRPVPAGRAPHLSLFSLDQPFPVWTSLPPPTVLTHPAKPLLSWTPCHAPPLRGLRRPAPGLAALQGWAAPVAFPASPCSSPRESSTPFLVRVTDFAFPAVCNPGCQYIQIYSSFQYCDRKTIFISSGVSRLFLSLFFFLPYTT